METSTADTAAPSMPSPRLIGCGFFEWINMVKLAAPLLKRASFMAAPWIGLHADTRTGIKVHPGHKRLNECKMSDNTITTAFRDLIANGLLRCVFKRKRGDPRDLADEYELTYPDDLAERLAAAGVDAPLMLEPLPSREADTHAQQPGADSEPGHTDRPQNLNGSPANHGGHLPMDHLPRDQSIPPASESSDHSGPGPMDRSTESAIDLAQARLGAASGRTIDRAWAARVVRHLTNGRSINKSPAAYVARCIDDARDKGTIDRLLPTQTPPPVQPPAPAQDPPATDEPDQAPAEEPPAAPAPDDADTAPWDQPQLPTIGDAPAAAPPPDTAPTPTPATAPKGEPTADATTPVILSQARQQLSEVKDRMREQRGKPSRRRGRSLETV